MKLQTEIENPLISPRHPIKDTQQEPLEIYGHCRVCGETLHYEDEPLDFGTYVLCDRAKCIVEDAHDIATKVSCRGN